VNLLIKNRNKWKVDCYDYFIDYMDIGFKKSEEGKAFVHANCVFVHEAELSVRCNSCERKRSYSRVLYLVLLDTSLESESVTVY
jgi:hypothetical protein